MALSLSHPLTAVCRRSGIAVLLFALAFLSQYLANAQCTTWMPLSTSGVPGSTLGQSLAVESSGVPYIAYNNPAGHVICKSYSGGTWTAVDSAGTSESGALGPRLVIDGSDNLYLTYSYNDGVPRLVVKKLVAGSWATVATVIEDARIHSGYSLAFGASDVPHLAYVHGDGYVVVKKLNAGAWDDVGDAPFSVGDAPVLAFSSTGVPYVAATAPAGILVSKFNAGAWESVGGMGGFVSTGVAATALVISPSGTPYISVYYSSNGYVLRYNGVSWELVTGGAWAPAISLTIDAAGDIYSTGYDPAYNDRAVVRKLTGDSWQIVGQSGISDGYAYAPVIASNNGHTYIAYGEQVTGYVPTVQKMYTLSGSISGTTTLCAGSTTTLSHATTGGTWIAPAACGIASVNSSTGVVTATSAGTPTIYYSFGYCRIPVTLTVNAFAGNIMGERIVNAGSSVTMTTTGSAGGSWTTASAAIATVSSSGVVTGVAAGTTTISYTVSGSCGSAVATSVVTVNPAASSICRVWNAVATVPITDFDAGGLGSDLRFDADGIAYIAVSDPNYDYKATVKKLVSGSWVTVGSPGFSSGAAIPALAVQADGTPFVAFTDIDNGNKITVMKYDGSSWTVVGAAGFSPEPGGGIQIEVTDCGVPYVSYANLAGMVLMKYNGTSWVVLGSGFAFSGWQSFALDKAGIPYAIFSGYYVGNLAVRKYINDRWTDVGDHIVSGTYFEDALITVSPDGTPFVVFQDVDNSNRPAVFKYSSGAWTALGSPATITSGYYNIRADAQDNLYLSFSSASAVSSFVYKHDGVSWSTPATGSITNSPVNLSLNYDGDPYITTMGPDGRLVVSTPGNFSSQLSVSATIAVGDEEVIFATSVGGIWSSSDPAVAYIHEYNGYVIGASVGTTTLSYTIGSCMATQIVTVTGTCSIAAITGTGTVCPAASATLSNATSGGTWSSSNTAVATIGSASGEFTGISSGTAIITYQTAGCNTTTVVTVTASPSAGTITGTLSTCTAATTTLSNATTGGTWSSSNTAVSTVNSSTGVVTGVAAGNATITYTNTNSCGSATTTVVVTVNAATSAGTITGTASICTGGTTTLSNAVTGGTWSSSNTAVATVNSTTGVITGVDAGNATITYTVSGACGTATATTVVTVGATAGAITGSLAICPGTTSSLTIGSAGTWSSSNTSVATIGSASGVLTGVANGTATISFTSGAGCTATAVATVSLPAVLTGTFNACVGQTSTLSSATTGGVWSSANSAIASVDASTGVVTGVVAGSAYITYATGTCYRTGNFVVKALPPAISGPVTVCAGGTTYVPPPTATGYSWTSSNTSVATIGSSTGILTGVAAGTTTLTYTTNTGCYTTTVATVNTAPAAITGTTSLCAGSTATLSSATAGGTWSSSNTGKATIGSATGIVTAVNAGTATITYNAGGCRTTTVVTVSAIAAITGSTSMCLGSSVNLTHATSGGTWASSNTAVATVGTSGTVTGVSAGTANITYTIPSGCSRSVTVTVAATPGGVTGTLTACPGTTTTLGSATAGGTWGGGNATIATINSSTGVVSGIGAGTITATYTIGTGCRSTAIVTINPLPAVMTGTFNVCVGLASTLASASAGGTWSTANAAIATADPSTGAITGVAAGTVAVSYTLPTGCYRSGAFTVKALPPAPAASAACEGTTTAIPAPSTNGRSWSSSNTAVATIGSSSGVMTGVTAGTTVLTYTTITGCYSTTVATVYTLPSAGTITGPTTVIAGNTITLDNATTGGVWSSSNTSRATIGAATGIVTGVAAGSATISYSVSNPGCTVRATQVISVTASRDNSPATAAATTVQLYPNPTTGAFTVVSQEAGMLSVYSLDGKQVTGYSIAAGANQLTLPADLAAGIYMCRYTSESGASTMVRLVYER